MKYLALILLCLGCLDTAKEDCDELSMQIYKGVPLSRKKFDEKCQGTKIKYTQEVCQSALAYLIKTNDLQEVKEEFGPRVEGCFTSNDLKKF